MHEVAAPLPGAFVLERRPKADARGSFARLYCADALRGLGIDAGVVQINLSTTAAAGTIRGLHFQHPPHAEIKVVQCVKGAVFDAVLDLRRGSAAFGRHFTRTLSAANGRAVVVPEGCAHGFQALEDDSLVVYAVTRAYAPGAEGGLRFDDPFAGIAWPLPACGISSRDLNHPPFDPTNGGIMTAPTCEETFPCAS